ncbi:MAG: hypothetical protein ABI183_20110 [Polyangiaceae bacterium]
MKTTLTILAALISAAAPVLTGCSRSPTSSSDVELSGIYTTYTLTTELGNPPTATAQFQIGDESGGYLDLANGDAVSCADTPLVRVDSGDQPLYRAVLPSETSSFNFVFTRPGEPAYPRHVDASPPLRITTDALDGDYDSQFDVAWTTEDTREGVVTIQGVSTADGCPLTVLTTRAADIGKYSFDGSPFRPADKSDPICNYTLQVMRDVGATAGSPFAGGRAISRSIGSTPLRFHKQ